MKAFVYFAPLLLLSACNGGNSNIVVSHSCSIEQPITNAVIPAAQEFMVSGWAFDKQSGILSDHVRIQFISTNRLTSKTFEAKSGIIRGDVAQALNTPLAEPSGFSLVVPANSLVAGSYEIVILQESSKAVVACSQEHVYLVK